MPSSHGPYTVSLKGTRDADLEEQRHGSRYSTLLLDLAQDRCCPLLSLQSLEDFVVVLRFRPLEGVGPHLKVLQKPTKRLMRLQLTSLPGYRKETMPRPKKIVGSDLSPIAAEYGSISACSTQNTAKLANKIAFLLLIGTRRSMLQPFPRSGSTSFD
jgi:hypothetical protein